jgi:hypothetical protein
MLNRLTCLTLVLVAVAILLIAPRRVEAARDFAPPATSEFEIVVVEVNGCKYCPLFRQAVAPAYSATPRARQIPLRFLDITAEGADKMKLKSPITIVPTAVLLRNHVEIGRIEGFVGAEDFSRLVTSLLSQ